jgi:colanic acid biosynthesis glycosyl transferase WcaI
LRILIHGLNYAPELTGIGKYSGEMGAWLIARGHEVRVVTAPPYYPAWKIDPPYSATAYRAEDGANKSRVYRCPIYVPAVPSGIKRIAYLFSFALSSLPILLKLTAWEPDVILTVEPTFFGAPMTLLAGAMSNAPCWLHIQDFEVDAAFDLEMLPAGGFLQRFALSLEGFFTRRFSRVSSISGNMVDRLLDKGVPKERALLFPNWVDIDAISPLSTVSRYRTELGLEGKFVLLYSGNLGNKQGLEILDPLCESFRDDPRVHFLVCGNGSLRTHLEDLARTHSNLTLLPLQPSEQLSELLSTADLHLLPQRPGAADLVMPSKLTGMLASGRPVMTTAEPGTQVARVVGGDPKLGTDPTGVVVGEGDVQAFHEAIVELMGDPELCQSLGAAARRYAVRYLGKEAILQQFEQDLERLVREHASDG